MGFAIAAGVALVGTAIAANSSAHASTDAHTAAAEANAMQQGQYNQTRSDTAAYRDAGAGALQQINSQMGDINRPFSMSDFQADPGYQFRMDEGNKAIERSSAARGTLGGDTLKALNNYSQNTASNEYDNAFNRYNSNNTNRFNRLASVAGIGQTATGQTIASGQNSANQQSENTIGAGNASAASSIATGNAASSGMNQGMNTWMQYQMMNRYAPQQQTQSPTSGFQGSGYFNGANPYS